MNARAYLHRIATATPPHNVHHAFVRFADGMLRDERTRALFLRMAERSGIDERYSFLQASGQPDAHSIDATALYRLGNFASTGPRMELYRRFAPRLMRCALDRLALSPAERARIRHVIVTSCTGMYAPGLDFEAMEHLGLHPQCERTTIGFMGCYAAINALKQARHIVRSQPGESVLVVNLELCTLHMQETQQLNEVLSFLLFADGCAASLVSSEPAGVELESFAAYTLPHTEELITWQVGDGGFDMVLSGQVPTEIAKALRSIAPALGNADDVSMWAVHPGGRSVLDAVEHALALPPAALAASREVLRTCGNMSSATVMFVLQALMRSAQPGARGVAMSFGPGLTAETMRFRVCE